MGKTLAQRVQHFFDTKNPWAKMYDESSGRSSDNQAVHPETRRTWEPSFIPKLVWLSELRQNPHLTCQSVDRILLSGRDSRSEHCYKSRKQFCPTSLRKRGTFYLPNTMKHSTSKYDNEYGEAQPLRVKRGMALENGMWHDQLRNDIIMRNTIYAGNERWSSTQNSFSSPELQRFFLFNC